MTRRAILAAALAACAIGAAGCDSGEVDLEDQPPPRQRAEDTLPRDDAPAPPTPKISRAQQLLEGWLAALQVRDYPRAARYFARGAIVDQGVRYRLRTRAEAIYFNSRLPCSASLVGVRGKGRRVLATFVLSAGPGGNCVGYVRVRVTIRRGRIAVFHQLLEPPPGERSPA